MAQSIRGDTGQSVQTIMNDKIIIVGDHPNLNPSVYTDPTGKEIDSYGISGSGGMINAKSATAKYTAIDNSGDFHGGTFSIVAMNSFNIEAANGGVNIETGGNINISSWGGITSIIGSLNVGINSQQITITSNEITLLEGPDLYINTDNTTFNKNVIFGNNVMVNGGMVINGELMIRHLTCLRSLCFTALSAPLNAYPVMGARLQCQFIPEGISTLPDESGGLVLPGMCTLIFSPVEQIPIAVIPPHMHAFDGPDVSYADSPTALFEEMKKAESTEAATAKPHSALGMSPNILVDKATKSAQNTIGTFIKEMLPF